VIGPSVPGRNRDRGQLVLVAAGVLAVALVPILFAYLQLGYHGDVTASTDYENTDRNAQRFLDRTVHDATVGVSRNHSWRDRIDAVDAVRNRVNTTRTRLETAHVESGIVYQTAYNQTAAQGWVSANCPGGPDRQFGRCVADRGVVVQNRVGETHVLAVVIDVTITTERGTRRLTFVVEPDESPA
jgi:hypothetical protein